LLRFFLGEPAPAGAVADSIFQCIALNLLVTAPIYALVRRLLRPPPRPEGTQEVTLVG
jgi:hypothetical protein